MKRSDQAPLVLVLGLVGGLAIGAALRYRPERLTGAITAGVLAGLLWWTVQWLTVVPLLTDHRVTWSLTDAEADSGPGHRAPAADALLRPTPLGVPTVKQEMASTLVLQSVASGYQELRTSPVRTHLGFEIGPTGGESDRLSHL